MNTDSDVATWTHIAMREAKEFGLGLRIVTLIVFGFWALLLVGCAYYDVKITWLIVIGFLGVNSTICTAIFGMSQRLDAGRSYLEQCCTEIKTRIDDQLLGR